MSDFLDTILDSAEDIIGGFGDNFANNAEWQAAKIRRENVKTSLALEEQKARLKRQEQREKLAENVVFAMLGILALIVIMKFVVPAIPKIK